MYDLPAWITVAFLLVGGFIRIERRLTRVEGLTKFRRATENDFRLRIERLEREHDKHSG